jgi:hypothetical protein
MLPLNVFITRSVGRWRRCARKVGFPIHRALYLFDLQSSASAPTYVMSHDNRSTTQRVDRRERNASLPFTVLPREDDRSAHKKELFIADRPIR